MRQTLTTVQSLGQILQGLTLTLKRPKTSSKSASKPSATTSTEPAKATDCTHCHGLSECLYTSHRGFQPLITSRGTALAECHYLTKWKVQRRQDNLQADSGIPLAYRHLSFDYCQRHCGNSKAIVAATELQSLYLSGPSGSGKTLLLSLIGNEHIKRGRAVQYVTAAEMLLQLRYSNVNCEQRLRHYQNVRILLLDDLGSERCSEYGEEQLQMVIEGRQRLEGITVIGSTRNLQDLENRYNTGLTKKIEQHIKREETLSAVKVAIRQQPVPLVANDDH